MTNNAYYERMHAELEAFKTARTKHTGGRDSEDMFPFKTGEMHAYYAMGNSYFDDDLVVDGELFGLKNDDLQEFIGTLHKAGVESFVYIGKSTSCMDDLHDISEAGCTMVGLVNITKEIHSPYTRPYSVRGVRFNVK